MGLDASKQAAWVIDFRVLAQADGQPDFMEAFQCLDRRIGKTGKWHPLSDLADFKVIKTETRTIYAMEVLVQERLIDLLKWQDIEQDDLRILDERLATKEESILLIGSEKSSQRL
jgi:hypothetical protein